MEKGIKKIKPIGFPKSKNQVFDVIFNPSDKKSQDDYKIVTECITSVTICSKGNHEIYIDFLNAKLDEEVTIYNLFLTFITTINSIEICKGDRYGNIVDRKTYNGMFIEAAITEFSFSNDEHFIAVFQIDK